MKKIIGWVVPFAIVSTVSAGWQTTITGRGTDERSAYNNAKGKVWPGYRIVSSFYTWEGRTCICTLICERD